jgi:hypothetical protein
LTIIVVHQQDVLHILSGYLLTCVIQHAKRMRRIILSSVVGPAVQIEGVQNKVDLFNMSNLFTKIYNMLYYTTNLYLQ